MTRLLEPDICVIGAGSGGLTVAAAAAAFGVPVVLVEKGRMGGDCLNYGCVPSKALLAAGKRAEAMRSAGSFGITPVEPEIDFRKVMRHVQSVIAGIAPNDSAERFAAMGVHVIHAEGRFKDRRTVAAGDFEIRARRFVVATGSSPALPPIPGLDTVPVLTNETIFERYRRPAHLVVIGGGPVGIELAQAHRRLGSEVTVIEAAEPLSAEDPEPVALLLDHLSGEGIAIRRRTRVTRVEPHGRSGVRVYVDGDEGAATVDGTHLLVATGRTPNIEGLGLDKAGIRHSAKGIEVSSRLRTSNRRIYAIGDVTGPPYFTHLANHHAGLVIRALLFRLPAKLEAGAAIPRVTYTDPELAHVGMTEEEARAAIRGRPRVLRWPFSENDRAQAEHETHGFFKMVVDSGGRILGVTILGAGAGEMIGLWSLALSKKMRVQDVLGYIAPYPTMGEIGKRAALAYFKEATGKGSVRGILRLLRLFG